MRILLAILFLTLSVHRLDACSCAGGGTPCDAAGRAAAAFTGKVLEIRDYPAHPFQIEAGGPNSGGRLAQRTEPIRLQRAFRIVRMEVSAVLSGVAAGQKEIE